MDPPPRHPSSKASVKVGGKETTNFPPPPRHPTSSTPASGLHVAPSTSQGEPIIRDRTAQSEMDIADAEEFSTAKSSPVDPAVQPSNPMTEDPVGTPASALPSPAIPGSLKIAPQDGSEDDLSLRLSGMDTKALKKMMEDEEIERYLISFGRHVHHLRVPDAAPTAASLPRPSVTDYTFAKVSARQAANQAETEDLPDIETPQESLDKHQSWTYGEVDWMAYASAYCRYMFGPATPLPPLEPFTVARLRSNAERLYVVARPTWESFGSSLEDILLWKNKLKTGVIAVIYLTLTLTSTLLPAVFLLPLYPLLKYRFFPPSPLAQYKATQSARLRSQEVSELVEEMSDDPLVSLSQEEGVGQGLGVGLDFRRAREGLGRAGMAVDEVWPVGPSTAESELGDTDETGEEGQRTKEKKKKKKRKMRDQIEKMEAEYGAGAVVVLGDLADLHEKLKNLYLWRSPQTSTKFSIILTTLAFLSYVTPLWILVMILELALGAVGFIVVPLIAAQERYEPMSWMAGDAPTDAEYAMQLIKARATAGEPLSIPKRTRTSSLDITGSSVSLPSTLTSSVTRSSLSSETEEKKGLDWEKVKILGGKGARLLETSRQIVAGEKEVKIGFAGSQGLDGGEIGTSQFRLGRNGPGLVFRHGTKAIDEAESVSYFAQHGRTPGNLQISPTQILFTPLIPSKPKPPLPEAETPTTNRVHIPMNEVVGIRKRDKSSLLVVVAAGLEIECIGGKVVRFALVSNRDQAFHQLLAVSDKAFVKV